MHTGTHMGQTDNRRPILTMGLGMSVCEWVCCTWWVLKVLRPLPTLLSCSCVALFVGRLLCRKQIKFFSTATHPYTKSVYTYLPHLDSVSLCLPRHCIFTSYTDSRAVAQSKVGVSYRPPLHLLSRLNCSATFRWLHARSAWLENATCKMRRVKQIEKCCTWPGN